MLQKTENNRIKILVIYYIVIVLWWLLLFFLGSENNLNNYLFVFFYGVIPFMGGIFGIINSKKWGFLKSAIGKSMLFISLGLISWAIGESIWSFYNIFLNVEVPYPSLADAGYILSWPLWGIGMYYLSKATGAKYGLRSSVGKSLLLIIPIIVTIASYYLLVVVARGGVLTESLGDYLKLFFDLAYPVGDVIILTVALLIFGLSFKYLGGKFKTSIYLIIMGFIINYLADFSFSYTTTLETYFSGNWVDLLFTTALFILSLGVCLFDPATLNKKEASK